MPVDAFQEERSVQFKPLPKPPRLGLIPGGTVVDVGAQHESLGQWRTEDRDFDARIKRCNFDTETLRREGLEMAES